MFQQEKLPLGTKGRTSIPALLPPVCAFSEGIDSHLNIFADYRITFRARVTLAADAYLFFSYLTAVRINKK